MGLRWLFLIVFLIWSPMAQATNSVEALQLDLVPIDLSTDCSQIFFRSTQHHQGTIFVMPNVIAGATKKYRELFEIESTGNGRYLLSLGVYFPRSNEAAKIYEDEAHRDMVDVCNYGAVKYNLNRHQPADNQIHTIAPMPLTSIEIRITGVKKPARIGRVLGENIDQEVDILDYFGKSYVVEFDISEEEKDNVQKRLKKAEGISASVKFRFQARGRNGSASIKVDKNELKANFKAAIQGKKFLAKLDLESSLRSAFSDTNVLINMQASSDKSFQKMSETIIKRVLDAVKFESQPEKEASTKKGSPDKEGLVSVQAALDVLMEQLNLNVNMNLTTVSEAATSEKVVTINASLSEPNTQIIAVRAGDPPLTTDSALNAGEMIKFSPYSSSLAAMTLKSDSKPITYEQLQEFQLHRKFPEIADNTGMTIENEDRNGVVLAVGTKSFARKFTWDRVEYRVRRTRKGRRNHIPQNMEAFSELPIFLSFSKLGDNRFALEDLIVDNEFWKGFLDKNNRIVIVAKKDLGLITFSESYEKGSENFMVKENVVMMEYRQKSSISLPVGEFNQKVVTVPGRTKWQMTVQQMNVLIRMTLPTKADPQGSINEAMESLDLQ